MSLGVRVVERHQRNAASPSSSPRASGASSFPQGGRGRWSSPSSSSPQPPSPPRGRPTGRGRGRKGVTLDDDAGADEVDRRHTLVVKPPSADIRRKIQVTGWEGCVRFPSTFAALDLVPRASAAGRLAPFPTHALLFFPFLSLPGRSQRKGEGKREREREGEREGESESESEGEGQAPGCRSPPGGEGHQPLRVSAP